MEKNIIMLYEQSLAEDANMVMTWLVGQGIAHLTGEPIKEDDGFCQYQFVADRDISADSAIIFVSDQATYNTNWQKCVRAIPSSYRLIPAGAIRDVDYNDPDVLPPSIEEINFIILNEHKYENILDSLITNPEFFQMKNFLLNKSHAWRTTNNDGDLLSNKKQIIYYQTEVLNKEKTEKDPVLKSQLSSLLEYLDASEKYAKKISKSKVFRWIRRGVLSAIAVAFIVLFFVLKTTYYNLTSINLLLSTGATTGEPKTNAIKMVEAFRNPLNPYEASKIARERLVDYLDIAWEQTPVGYNYKYLLNDCAIPKGTNYLWTASENGAAILWDTYTGEIKEKTLLTDTSLCVIALDQDVLIDENSVLSQNGVVIDEEGTIYLRTSEKWSSKGNKTNADPNNAECVMNGNWILIYDAEKLEVYEVVNDCLVERWSISCDGMATENVNFQKASVSTDGQVIIAYTLSNQLYTAKWDGDEINLETQYPVVLSELSAMDIKNGILIVTDEKGQVYYINGLEQVYAEIPLILEKPISVRIINEETIVYHERNRGTGVYDLNRYYDYGDVLASYTTVQDIFTTEELLVLKIHDAYYPIDWSDILPVNVSDKDEIEIIHDGINTSNESPKAIIRTGRISKYGLICLELFLNNNEERIILDPLGILNNKSGYSSIIAKQDLPSVYHQYNEELFVNKAMPTVIGIRHIPANNLMNVDFDYLLVGMEDGTFVEIGFYDSEKGYASVSWKHQIPSRSPICSITEIKDGYLLTDENGQIWKCGSGINLFNYKGAYEIVNRKLHSGITQDLWDMLSTKTRKNLNLFVYPGGDGKEWE